MAALLLVAFAPGVEAQAQATIDTQPSTFPESVDTSFAAWAGGYAYILGGGGGEGLSGPTDSIYRYDVHTDDLVLMPATLPMPLATNAGAYDESRYIYLFGGWTGSEIVDSIIRYDTMTDTVTTMDATLPNPSRYMAAAWQGSYAYIFGGTACRSDRVLSCNILRYDPSADQLDMLLESVSPPFRGASAVTHGGHIYLFGANGEDGDAIFRFDPAAESLTRLSATLPEHRDGPVAISDGSTIYIIGGWQSPRGTTSIFTFDPATQTMGTYSRVLPHEIVYGSAVWGSTGLVFGGDTKNPGTNPHGPADRIHCFDCQPTITVTCTVLEDGRVEYTAFASTFTNGSATTYDWEHGDGFNETTSSNTTTYSYGASTHTVNVTVTDAAGRTATASAACGVEDVDGPCVMVVDHDCDGDDGSDGADGGQSRDGGDGDVGGHGGDGGQSRDGGEGDGSGELDGSTASGPTSGDADGDGAPDGSDSCPHTINPNQRGGCTGPLSEELEAALEREALPDADGDGVPDKVDNCVHVFNPGQLDFHGDGLGDACGWQADGDCERALPEGRAERSGDSVRVSWTYEGCPVVGFFVWLEEHAVAWVPYGEPYEVRNEDAPPGEHRYWIQVAGAEDAFDATRAVPVEVEPDDDDFDSGSDRDAGTMGDSQREGATGSVVSPWPWLLLGFGGVVLVVAWRRSSR